MYIWRHLDPRRLDYFCKMSSGTSLIGQVEIPNANLTKSLVSMVESDISAMELQLPDNEDSNNTGCATCYKSV